MKGPSSSADEGTIAMGDPWDPDLLPLNVFPCHLYIYVYLYLHLYLHLYFLMSFVSSSSFFSKNCFC
jgi:hypothetical protein